MKEKEGPIREANEKGEMSTETDVKSMDDRRGPLTGEIDMVGAAQKFAMFCICVFVLFLMIRFLTGEKREYSESENRALAQLPELSAETIRDGSLTAGLEKYISDQFPMRDGFLTVMTEAERLSGRREINDVYLADNGFLIKAYEAPQNTERIVTQFRKLAENVADSEVNVRLMLVPTQVSVYRDHLPAFSPDLVAQTMEEFGEEPVSAQYPETGTGAVGAGATQMQTIEEIYARVGDTMETIDVAAAVEQVYADSDTLRSATGDTGAENADDGTLAGAGRTLYYRTDHHWTTCGAYVGYMAYCEAADLQAKPLEKFVCETVSTDFRGTTYARLNDPHFGYDTIVTYTDPEQKLMVVYEDTGEVSDSLYNYDYLSQRDQYSFFLNNIHPLITITNDSAPEGALALVKDSYANSLVPFLVSHYRTIYVFDTRYYRGSPSAFIKEHTDIRDVLILYNMNTIDADTGIGGIF